MLTQWCKGWFNWLSNLREISPWPYRLHVPPDVLKLKGKALWELRILFSPLHNQGHAGHAWTSPL